jgi:hypothetical protein
MKPIQPPFIIKYGIVVYVPSKDDYNKSKIEIYYSPKNPLFDYSQCNEANSKIWEKKDTMFNKGTLYLYTTNEPLKKGFYQIKLTMYDNFQTKFIEGINTYGILKEKDTLHIGIPYSTFGPILTT